MTPEEIERELDRGARFVLYTLQIGTIADFQRRSKLRFNPAGRNAVLKGLPYSLVTLLLGWWDSHYHADAGSGFLTPL